MKLSFLTSIFSHHQQHLLCIHSIHLLFNQLTIHFIIRNVIVRRDGEGCCVTRSLIIVRQTMMYVKMEAHVNHYRKTMAILSVNVHRVILVPGKRSRLCSFYLMFFFIRSFVHGMCMGVSEKGGVYNNKWQFSAFHVNG